MGSAADTQRTADARDRSRRINCGEVHDRAAGTGLPGVGADRGNRGSYDYYVSRSFAERGLEADHTTIWRWVQRCGPELEQRLRRHLKPTNKSWRVDETYIRVKGRWCYLYRAIDSTGTTIDFLLSALTRKRLNSNTSSPP